MEQTTLNLSKKKPSTFSAGYKFATLMILVALIVGIGMLLLPYAQQFLSEEGRALIIESIQNKGIGGMIFFVFIQIIQIVIFVIPGEAVEVLGGMVYGTWWGYIVCQIGITMGTIIIFYMVKGLGYDFIKQFIDESKFEKLSFLQNNKKVEKLVFILFLIPGTPKDVITYFVPFTDLSLGKFLFLSGIARVPAVISSTFAGAALQQGAVGTSLMTFAIVAVVSIAGIWFNRKFMNQQNKVVSGNE